MVPMVWRYEVQLITITKTVQLLRRYWVPIVFDINHKLNTYLSFELLKKVSPPCYMCCNDVLVPFKAGIFHLPTVTWKTNNKTKLADLVHYDLWWARRTHRWFLSLLLSVLGLECCVHVNYLNSYKVRSVGATSLLTAARHLNISSKNMRSYKWLRKWRYPRL